MSDDVSEPVAGDVEFQNVVRCVAPQFVFCGIFLIGVGIVKFSVFFVTSCSNINSTFWMTNGILISFPFEFYFAAIVDTLFEFTDGLETILFQGIVSI